MMTEGKNRTIWTQDFRVRAYEAGGDGVLRPDVLCDYLQDAAANHAVALDVASDFNGGSGLIWVLSRLVVEVSAYPAWSVPVRVTTWPSGIQGIFATRDFEVGTGGSTAARATTAWFLIDTARRRPARLPVQVTDLVLPERPRAMVDDFSRLPSFQGLPTPVVHCVGPGSVDINGHVNHVRYLSWALDALETDWHRSHSVRRIHMQFRSEAVLGQHVQVERAPVENDPLAWHHAVRDPAGNVICQARTDWTLRR